MDSVKPEPEYGEDISLEKAVELLLTEVRTVLPGIQTLFGFQLIAVFNAGFSLKLSVHEQYLHLVALGMLAVAMALILTPAAYQRLAGARRVTDMFVWLCERMLLWSMIPLVFGICIDFYLVSRVIVGSPVVVWLTAALFTVFVFFWFVVPRTLVARSRRPTQP